MTESADKVANAMAKPGGLVQEVTVAAASKEGFAVHFTLRDHDTQPLVIRLNGLMEWLPKNGFVAPPTPPVPEPVVVNVAAAAGGKDDDGEGDEEEHICEYHHLPMSKHEKDGQVWWSHKLPNGKYCKGKPPYGA